MGHHLPTTVLSHILCASNLPVKPTMTSTAKYQPAPQRDSLDEGSYPQPPPSYQAAGPSVTEGGYGTPRAEDDNVPDDFKFGGSVSEATIDIRMSFIRKVYSILTVQLLLTAGLSCLSFFSSGYRNWIQSNSWMMWVSLFGAIGFMLLTFWKRKSYPTNMIFLAPSQPWKHIASASSHRSTRAGSSLKRSSSRWPSSWPSPFLLARPSTTSRAGSHTCSARCGWSSSSDSWPHSSLATRPPNSSTVGWWLSFSAATSSWTLSWS